MTVSLEAARLLIVEDDEVFAELTSVILGARGYRAEDIAIAPTIEEATELLRTGTFDLILADMSLPDADGLEVVRRCREITPDVPIIVLTACRDVSIALDALHAGAQDYLTKGEFDDEGLTRAIRYARARARADADLRATVLALEESNRRLEESNAQLEQYATIASHDLRSPVRTARVLVGRMIAATGEPARAEAVPLATTLDGCLARLETMLEGLLDYAQARDLLSSGDVVEERLSALVDETSNDLDAELREAGAQITMLSDAVVHGHPVLLRSLLRNLIQNAVKYRSEQPLRIIVSAEVADGRAFVRIADNGRGIEPRFRERVFVMFEQLQARSAGIGLGLTQCHRVVSLHGGQISIEDGLDGGIAVCFSLPATR